MRYWWVNHKQTRKYEVKGDYLWSPKTRADGARNEFYDNMVKAMPGDMVFSFADGQIGAWGIVQAEAYSAPKPTEFGNTGHYWDNEGWLLEVAFQEAPVPVAVVAHIDEIAPLLPSVYSPIRSNGHGNQGAYLAAISDDLGALLIGLIGAGKAVKELLPALSDGVVPEVADIEFVNAMIDVPETQKRQLVASRIGQGLFRRRALLMGAQCRVTGVSEKRLLRASLIKPWRESDNFERLDGANGLMLSPHIDALFDQALMTFSDAGGILVSKNLDPEILQRWSISKPAVQTGFSKQQQAYLALHRDRTGADGLIAL